MGDERADWSSKYRGLRDYHLRSALTSGCITVDMFGDWEKNIRREISGLKENYKTCIRDPCKILGIIFDKSPLLPTYNNTLFQVGKCLEVESEAYESMAVPLLASAGRTLMSNIFQTRYYAPSMFFQRAIIVANALNAKKDLPKGTIQSSSDIMLGTVTMNLNICGIKLIVGSECFGAILTGEDMSIHHIDHLKNWSDKCTERLNVEFACIFGHQLNPTIYPPVTLIYDFFKIYDRELIRSGNSTYKCVKIFEAMVIGVILEKNPNEVISPEFSFLTSTITDFRRGLPPELGHLGDPVIQMLNFLMGLDSVQYLSQLYGLYRIWGHPIVDPRAGIRKVHDLGTKVKEVSSIAALQIRRVFMTKYAIWHKGSKGQYPEVQDLAPTREGNVVRDLILSKCATSELIKSISHPHWDEIRFKKCIEIPKTFNLAEMVADKSISPDRSGLYYLCQKGGSLYDANLKRGVLQWLTRHSESCENFLVRVNDVGLTPDELIIGLYQKEREVNETPRMFAVMGHSNRNYVVTTESMISTDILPAFPNITMTDSLLSLSKKIYSVSHRQAQNLKTHNFSTYRDVTIVVNIDFEKWNLNFRRDTTFPLFEAIGDLYGLEHLYNRTYDIFEQSMIYLADGSYRPLIHPAIRGFVMEPPFSYMGHLGGFEGLRQKGWTVFTDCALELICSRHKCTYNIMGQGDNQVLSLTWRTYLLDEDQNVSELGKRDLTRQFRQFMQDMMSTFEELGLPMKSLETWTSENLFLYGKFPTLRGVPLAMSLKKICRAYYLANEEVMTLDCSVATIQSNAMAACMSDVTSFVPYVIYKIQLFLALKSFSEYHVLLGHGAFDYASYDTWQFTSSSGLQLSYSLNNPLPIWKFIPMLSWFPKILGGLSVASWYDFMMRGFPDRVASALTWISHLRNRVTDRDYLRCLELIYQGHINQEKNFVLLIEDPCALNLIVPVDAQASIKQRVQELFENLPNVRNQEFADLFSFNKTWDKETFCLFLCGSGVLHPRFLHDVAAATLGGYVDGVISKVTKSSTISKLSLRSSRDNPGRRIEADEGNYMKYLLWKFSRSNTEKSYIDCICPTQQARMLRLRSWDRILEGVTVPFPYAFLKASRCAISPEHMQECDRNYIMVSLPENFAKGDLGVIHSLGSSPPYLGSETKEKLGGDPSRMVFGKEPLIARPINLLRVINWFVLPGTLAEKVIHKLLTSVSNLDPTLYVSKEMGITGSEDHRYRDQALKHGVMSSNLYTLGSHMHISTDPWIKYTRGAENFTINYQALLCGVQSLIGGYIFHCHDNDLLPDREIHFHESCDECIIPVSDSFQDLISSKILDLIPSSPENPYLWVDESALTLKYRYDPLFNFSIPEITVFEYIKIQNKREILTSWIAADIVDDILSGDTLSHTPRLLESKDYPRVMYKKLSVQELWEETALQMISRSGTKYTREDNLRVAYPSTAKELAADDVMKCASGSLMGLAMFYTWPEKFSEIFHYDEGSVFPDANPPTLESACIAVQINIRNIIRRVKIRAPLRLIIKRTDKDPGSKIRCFWYRILCSENVACSSCLKAISSYDFPNEPISACKTLKCSINHSVISDRMLEIYVLTASSDKVLKDSEPSSALVKRISRLTNIPKIHAISEVLSRESMENLVDREMDLEYRPMSNQRWQLAASLPTSSKGRVYETLSILHHVLRLKLPENGIIFGDGLGTTSRIISSHYPSTNIKCASLHDSENAIPQSYPHALISENPDPDLNVDYLMSKRLYNDLTIPGMGERWSEWVSGGFCWCEIESPIDRLAIFSNILEMSIWDLLIIRTDFCSYEEASDLYNLLTSYYNLINIYVTGCLKVNHLECVLICRLDVQKGNIPWVMSASKFAQAYLTASDELFAKSNSLIYANDLAALEEKYELSRMLRRCDHWFAIVGVTHLLSCKSLFTPLYWDLQTGKIPSEVKYLGENKKYYMYISDHIALQARLVSLALSLVINNENYNTELAKYKMWELEIKHAEKEKRVKFTLRRSKVEINYGPDHLKILKFIPILRKLNHLHKRWWEFMPNKIKFSTNRSSPSFWVSRLSTTIKKSLPEYK
ncbi:TPA_asm: L [Trachyspermum ammi virus 1]|uniref:RNA-directed RNA polymerase n=1 Tax=Trachyspermum ammi virus 1 TaxID=2793743 RepID=A0A8D9PGY5_9RHAB|nr:L [Trachyspermum ammi virus 1] [Trachyspermum ammi virus 1]DAF42355.1 TPA_asm: L [Trachyspermum ammi virus 1]